MKRALKWMSVIVGALVVLLIVAVGAVYVLSNARMDKQFTVAVQAPPVPTDAEAITEGQRIFISRGCVDCHGNNLAGVTFVDDPMAGRFTGANLTSGQGGIGGVFTDEDFVRAVRHGVAPDGSALIFMPATDFYAMSDADMGALIAYIRSVPPVDKPHPEQAPGPIARLLLLTGEMPYLVSAAVIDHNAPPANVPVGLTVEYGRYVANTCTGCHGNGFSGGPIPGGAPEWPPAENLTQDADTGLAGWSESDFIQAVRTGVRPNGSKIRPPMPWENFSQLTDTEVKALWMFLKSVPPKAYGGR